MNRERARELLPIIQAFAEGKIIQARTAESAGWNSYDNGAETGFLDDFEYRIKPEPRVFWINPNKETTVNALPWWMTQTEYDSGRWSEVCKADFIRVIEDLSDD